MIIWAVIFILVILVAFVLTIRSMSDYQEKSGNFKELYSLYLVHKPSMLTAEYLKQLHQKCLKKRLIISFEKLKKGGRVALVIWGPKFILQQSQEELGLQELEDYTAGISEAQASCFDITTRQPGEVELLSDDEQLWVQLVLQPLCRDFAEQLFYFFHKFLAGGILEKKLPADRAQKEEGQFYAHQRVVIKSVDIEKRKRLQKQFGILPSTSTTALRLKNYQERSLPLRVGLYYRLNIGTVKALLS